MPQTRMNSLKSLAMNCGPLSEMIRGVWPGTFSRARWMMVCTSDSSILSRISQWTMNRLQPSRTEQRKKKVPGDVEIADIDVPVLMGSQGLDEARAFLGGRGRLAGQESGGLEDAVDAGGAAGDDVGVEHHEGLAAIAFQGVLAGEEADGLLLRLGEPVIAGAQALCSLTLPKRHFQSWNLLAPTPIQGRKRQTGMSVLSAQARTKSTTWSRVSWGTSIRPGFPKFFF